MRKWMIIGILFLTVSGIEADKVNKKMAGDVAMNFYNAMWDAENNANIRNTDYITSGADTLFYLFHFDDDKFVFVSADDAAYPVPGYGIKSSSDWAEAHSSVKGWIKKYKGEMKLILERDLEATPKIRDKWQSLLEGDYKGKAGGDEPLLYSTWNQNWPYNAMAPADQAGSGGHTFVGCVAVSMAQVMYYYRYPESGTGSYNYYHSKYGNLSADFGNADYNYNAMVDDLKGKENQEVAELLYHSAVSVEMGFSPNGSGASFSGVVSAMDNYFKYASSITHHSKNSYSNSQWKSMIRNEIDNNRPLLYSGFPDNGAGHAFNLDGYQGSDHFHFNWGWSGMYDGYFYLTSLNPGASDFTYYQAGIFNVKPGGSYPFYCSGTDTLSAMRGTFEDGSGYWDYSSNSSCSWLIDPVDTISHIELSFKDLELESQNDYIRVYDGESTNATMLAEFSGDTVPKQISSSGKKLYVTFNSNSNQNFPGFHASYKAYPPVFCNSITTLSSPTGVISDGSGNMPYHDNKKCRWLIKPDGASWIKADFKKLNTANSNDFVALYDPSTSPGKQLGKYYGNSNPGQVTSNSGQMLVMFSTNDTATADGFALEYTSDIVKAGKKLRNKDLKIFPNPAGGKFRVEIPKQTNYEKIELRASDGTLVREDLEPGRNVTGISAGMYIVRLIAGEQTVTRKLIITDNE